MGFVGCHGLKEMLATKEKGHVDYLEDIMLIPNCTSGKDVYILAMDILKQTWDGWAHKPGLTHLSLVHSPEPSVVLCVHYQ